MKFAETVKKIRKCIASSKSSENSYCLSKQLAPVSFNTTVHGDNIKLSSDAQFAKRNQSFCKAIIFTNRPLLIGEEISVLVSSVSDSWSGSLRFGFCNINPNSIKNKLPKYMCPNLTNIQGFYARALQDEETKIGTVLTFWLNEYGQIMYKINGLTKGIFLQVDRQHINTPMWAMFDVYGLVTSIKLVSTKNLIFPTKPVSTRSMTELNNLTSNDFMIRESSPQHHNQQNSIIYSTSPVPKYYANVKFNRMQLSETVGANIKLNSSRTVASRKNLTSSQGYVFTRRPLNLNEKLVIQILKSDQLYNGNLGFGLTTCNPQILSSADLPADSHKLLDRNEYWIVIKDVLVNAKVGDELSFTINNLNQVQLTKNNLTPVTLMHVDATQKFYAFFDLHGKTTKIKVLGTYYEKPTPNAMQYVGFNRNLSQLNERLINTSTLNRKNDQVNLNCFKQCARSPTPADQKQPISNLIKTIDDGASDSGVENQSECRVCFEKSINCVLYQCGHMCMCYDCAIKQWQGVGNGGGQCPICRAYICDVIRTYKS